MSINDELMATGKVLQEGRNQVAISRAVLVAVMRVAKTISNPAAAEVHLAIAKKLANHTWAYNAAILQLADQLTEDLRAIQKQDQHPV